MVFAKKLSIFAAAFWLIVRRKGGSKMGGRPITDVDLKDFRKLKARIIAEDKKKEAAAKKRKQLRRK